MKDTRKLETIIKIMKDNKLKVRVGILGDNGSRKEGSLNNASIGVFHEFGTVKMPQRSFLRMPLNAKLDKYIQNSKGIFSKKVINGIYEERSLISLLKRVGKVAERVIDDAFQTRGFGIWPDLQAETWMRKKNLQILVETGQLRRSITSEVK